MAKNDSASLIDTLINDLAGISKGLQEAMKKVDDFQSELKKAKSVDVETQKLQRMIQKRSQIFDVLHKITDTYDQTAKNVIQQLGR